MVGGPACLVYMQQPDTHVSVARDKTDNSQSRSMVLGFSQDK